MGEIMEQSLFNKLLDDSFSEIEIQIVASERGLVGLREEGGLLVQEICTYLTSLVDESDKNVILLYYQRKSILKCQYIKNMQYDIQGQQLLAASLQTEDPVVKADLQEKNRINELQKAIAWYQAEIEKGMVNQDIIVALGNKNMLLGFPITERQRRKLAKRMEQQSIYQAYFTDCHNKLVQSKEALSKDKDDKKR